MFLKCVCITFSFLPYNKMVDTTFRHIYSVLLDTGVDRCPKKILAFLVVKEKQNKTSCVYG
jgi:hypothetical protein